MNSAADRHLDFSDDTTVLRVRYLKVLRSLAGSDRPVLLHLADLAEPVRAKFDCWCPALLLSRTSESADASADGVICVQELETPLGTLTKARIRESDLIALQLVSPLVAVTENDRHAKTPK